MVAETTIRRPQADDLPLSVSRREFDSTGSRLRSNGESARAPPRAEGCPTASRQQICGDRASSLRACRGSAPALALRLRARFRSSKGQAPHSGHPGYGNSNTAFQATQAPQCLVQPAPAQRRRAEKRNRQRDRAPRIAILPDSRPVSIASKSNPCQGCAAWPPTEIVAESLRWRDPEPRPDSHPRFFTAPVVREPSKFVQDHPLRTGTSSMKLPARSILNLKRRLWYAF